MGKIKKYSYDVNTNKIGSKRIVLLSDIHYYDKKEFSKLERITEELYKLKPDYICLAGDILDIAYVNDKKILYKWIKQISEVSKVIISIGNHDLLVEDKIHDDFDKELFNSINSLDNVTVLDNDVLCIDNICFMGITFPADYYYEVYEPVDYFIQYINKIFPKINSNKYNVLMCHSPLAISKEGIIDKLKIGSNLDLILSGHTHGGVTPEFLKPILKNVGLISPTRKLLLKNAYGHVKLGNKDLIISSGVTKASHRNRFHFLNPLLSSEITIVNIKNTFKIDASN